MLLLWSLLTACAPPPPPTTPDTGLDLPAEARWPGRTATLVPPEVVIPEGFGVHRIAVDPGHGTGDNTGTRTVACEDEADVVLALAEDLADRLEATGAFEVLLTREDADGPSYRRRLDTVTTWGAEALVSLHLDARGRPWAWTPDPGRTCWRNDDAAGFAVLVADRGDAPLLDGRMALARSLAASMEEAGFGPYDGLNYSGLYDRDTTRGVYLDRRVLFMLRKPTMPSVIVETHQGLDYEERERWREERTLAAFGAAVAAGLVHALTP